MAFTPKAISVSDEGIRQAEKIAEAKILLFQSAMKEAEKHIKITYFKKFGDDFIAYTIDKLKTKNKALSELNLSNDKLLDLLDINLNKLYEIQVEYMENKTKVLFDKDGSPFTRVDKNQYIQYTKNEDENKRLDCFLYFIEKLEEIAQYTHVYKGEVSKLTSGAVSFDLRWNKWRINPMQFRNTGV
jgi:hypothetical protein